MDQTSHLHVYVRIKPETAILQNSTLVGLCRVPLSAEWLASLTGDERRMLATLNPFEERYALQDNELLATPTLDGVLQYLRREIQAVEIKERKAQEDLARKDQGAIAALAEWFDKSDDDRVYATLLGDYEVHTPLTQIYYHGERSQHTDRLRASHPEVMQQYDAVIDRLKQHGAQRYREAEERRERDAEERKAKTQAERDAYNEERTAWIKQHGSEQLRALLDEGLGLDRTYRNERLQAEFPGSRWHEEVCGALKKAANASLEDIERMRALRAQYPEHDVQLQWLADAQHIDGCEHEEECGTPFEPRPVVTARVLGEIIVMDCLSGRQASAKRV